MVNALSGYILYYLIQFIHPTCNFVIKYPLSAWSVPLFTCVYVYCHSMYAILSLQRSNDAAAVV